MAFVSDTFTDTDAVLLQNHTGETGATWTKHPNSLSPDITITTNRAAAGGNDAIYYASGVPASADYDVESLIFFVTNTASSHFICGRMSTSANTFYGVRWNQGTAAWQLFKRVAGTFTQLGSDSAQAQSTGGSRTVKLEMRGTTITVYVDGVQIISVTDSSISAAGRVGFRANGATTVSGGHHDNISGTDASGGDTPIAGTDSATGTDDATAIELAGLAESGSGTDASSLDTGATAKSGSEAFTGTDDATEVEVNAAGPDGVATDAVGGIVLSGVGETGALSETSSLDTGGVPKAASESASGTDAASVTVTLARPEPAAAVDAAAAVVALGGLTDTATAGESALRAVVDSGDADPYAVRLVYREPSTHLVYLGS